MRHLLAAHHDADQVLFDLERLSLHPGRLEQLRDRVREVVEGDGPRTRWLRDLAVYERYHERLLGWVDAVLRDPQLLDEHARDPDLSLRCALRWCAEKPSTASEAWRAWRRGSLRFG